jgi:chromosome condensin MukBEF MukE localization factor
MTASKWDDMNTKVRKYKKDGFAVAHNVKGYNSYFLLPSDVQISDDEFKFGSDSVDVTDSRAAQTKLARDFAKHNVKNRQSRIILTKFAELIA